MLAQEVLQKSTDNSWILATYLTVAILVFLFTCFQRVRKTGSRFLFEEEESIQVLLVPLFKAATWPIWMAWLIANCCMDILDQYL